MKRLRLERLARQIQTPRPRICCLRQWQQVQFAGHRRFQSTGAGKETETGLDIINEEEQIEEQLEEEVVEEVQIEKPVPGVARRSQYAGSPGPEAALQSAKLGALHARLGLPKKLPLQTMARTLIDPSADPNPQLNNSSLAQVGGALIAYHVSEFLLCKYPRLPMTVLFSASFAYNGPPTLSKIAKEWGVETVAYPGPEVDPGLLQFSKVEPGTDTSALSASTRKDRGPHFRRGISSRNVYDDEFGDTIAREDKSLAPQTTDVAYSKFVKAVVGSLYLHAGRTAAKNFISSHILSRHLDIDTLFSFDQPVRELARLCKREEFEYPVARILSETGRHSIAPVFVVGIFSGSEKLGEGAAANLLEARVRASVNALKSWYLYSPGNNVRLPSETEFGDSKPWEPVHIDPGEIIH